MSLTALATLAAGCGGKLAGAPGQSSACFDDGGIDPSETPASGSFSGPAMSGVICGDGALVFVEDNLRGTAPAALYGNQNLQSTDGIRFQVPANVMQGELSIGIGMPRPIPGTYESSTTCGSVVLGALLPIPSDLDCLLDGGGCAPGCSIQGPILGAACEPDQPEIDFLAQTSKSCLGYGETGQGSFKLVLTSVDLEPTDAGPDTINRYHAHGSLTASLVGQAGDAGTSTVSLQLTF
jgi:hypothetical protein